MSSVVVQAGPSEPMTRNLASGRRSPTLMGMARILFDELGNRWGGGANLEHFPARWIPACGGKYDRRPYRSGREALAARVQSMIPKSGSRFSEKIMLQA